ncbi:MAG: glycogen synthase GlgA [Bacteroidetes bacterium]|jgi:starch synthase|nr:glycogen synthase GlgA [Bacteroidota bacterium]
MSKPLNILFVSSEVEPFAKTGGLADVSSALPRAIKDLGHEIRIVMPRYRFISERRFRLHDIIRLKDIPIPVGDSVHNGNVKSSFIMNLKEKVQVYFLDNETFFGREGVYQNPANKKDYKDNDERFIFFARGVLETLKRLGWQPEVIHCNDWQTGLIPVMMKTIYKHDPFFKNIKTVFTIHNMAYQGAFPPDSFKKSGLPDEVFHHNGAEAYGKFNFLKTALSYADSITTVSEKYAREICESTEFGAGLEGLLAHRKRDLHGLLNGIDPITWDPSNDNFIFRKYDAKSIEAKAENKKALLKRFDMEYDPQRPVIGAITRLVHQKGFDLVLESLEEMLKSGVHFVMLASGDKEMEAKFEKLHKKHPKQIALVFGFDEELAHMIEAGSDMFLMPSRYEPCGLNQMYSMRYGTIPIVRATGGLDDTVEDYQPGGKGTGFKFEAYDHHELLKTVQRAVQVYQKPEEWKKLMRNGMAMDYSWEHSAKKYIALYRDILKP